MPTVLSTLRKLAERVGDAYQSQGHATRTSAGISTGLSPSNSIQSIESACPLWRAVIGQDIQPRDYSKEHAAAGNPATFVFGWPSPSSSTESIGAPCPIWYEEMIIGPDIPTFGYPEGNVESGLPDSSFPIPVVDTPCTVRYEQLIIGQDVPLCDYRPLHILERKAVFSDVHNPEGDIILACSSGFGHEFRIASSLLPSLGSVFVDLMELAQPNADGPATIPLVEHPEVVYQVLELVTRGEYAHAVYRHSPRTGDIHMHILDQIEKWHDKYDAEDFFLERIAAAYGKVAQYDALQVFRLCSRTDRLSCPNIGKVWAESAAEAIVFFGFLFDKCNAGLVARPPGPPSRMPIRGVDMGPEDLQLGRIEALGLAETGTPAHTYLEKAVAEVLKRDDLAYVSRYNPGTTLSWPPQGNQWLRVANAWSRIFRWEYALSMSGHPADVPLSRLARAALEVLYQ